MKTSVQNIALLALAASSQAYAGSETWFTPLTESAPVVAPNALAELTAPWASPAGISQINIVSLREVEDAILSPDQSVVRVPGLGTGASMFDMIAYDPNGRYIFIPHETMAGAGVSRTDIDARKTEVLFSGDLGGFSGDWSNDWGAFDPCRFTPNGTLFLGEEWSGQGRVIEVMNPFADPADIEIRELHSIANVSHEGINFSEKYDDTIYFVDEDRSGSVYKFVMQTPGDYTVGQTFVLVVDAFDGDASVRVGEGVNIGTTRTGSATWVPLTDVAGTPLPGISDPFDNEAGRAGRAAADDAYGTPFRRPEDCEVSKLYNQNEVLFFAATEESTIYSVEMLKKNKAFVRVFASNAGTPKNEGYAPTTGIINSPDNLAQDALGNIYIIEDAPNGSSVGGDIWFCRDTDNDGVAESVDHFLSIRADGCEATGMIFNPAIPTEFVIAVQHPDSTDLNRVPNGLGDSVWMFDVSGVENQDYVTKLHKANKVGVNFANGKK